jgi:hypothetical protein
MAWGRHEVWRRPRFGWGFLGVAVAVMVGLAVLVPALLAGSAEPCCLANDRFQGTCTVVPGEGETCESILAYLNNPMSTGKSYCGGTRVRGGWAQVDCKTGKSFMQQGAAGSLPKAQRPAPAREKGASR